MRCLVFFRGKLDMFLRNDDDDNNNKEGVIACCGNFMRLFVHVLASLSTNVSSAVRVSSKLFEQEKR